VRKVYVSTVFDHSVDEVWAVLGDFHRIDGWMEPIHESVPEDADDQATTIGSIRRLTVGEDRHITRERLVAYDAWNRQMSYELPDTPRPFGMTGYLGTIHALPITDSGKTFVEWYGVYDCASSEDVPAIEEALAGVYTRFLGDLRAHLSRG
jgi:hypothetical protein